MMVGRRRGKETLIKFTCEESLATQGVKESQLRKSKVTWSSRYDGWVEDDNSIVSNETRYTERRWGFCWVEKVSSHWGSWPGPKSLPLIRAELFHCCPRGYTNPLTPDSSTPAQFPGYLSFFNDTTTFESLFSFNLSKDPLSLLPITFRTNFWVYFEGF